MTYALLCRS
jgi:hypothetical protein